MMRKLLLRYGLIGLLELVYCYIRTRFFYPTSRLIRFPFDIRGRKSVCLGKGLTTGKYCRIEAFPSDKNMVTISIGNNVQLNDFVHITAMRSVLIGNNVLLASKIYISDCSHGTYSGDFDHSSPLIAPIDREYSIKPVEIKDNVWIGESVSILPGVIIGTGAIIGANSVVTKNIPDYCIAVGNPANVIKKYNLDTKKWEKI